MPFKEVDIKQTIENTLSTDSDLKQIWTESRAEYHLLGELTRLRKAKGLSQTELARKTGSKQQVISRIENRENSPTLKTLCAILDVLECDIVFVPRQNETVQR